MATLMDITISNDMDLQQLRQIIHGKDFDCDQYGELPAAYRDRLLEEGLQGKNLKDVPFNRFFIMLEQALERVLDRRQAEEEHWDSNTDNITGKTKVLFGVYFSA